MDILKDYKKINKESWNNKVDYHMESEFYDVESFKKGKNSLNEIELNLLGSLEGKSVLHLQCHFGMDSISLARLGAIVTAVDFSDKAIDTAKQLADEQNVNLELICCDVLELDQHLDKKFDIVFTSYGTVGWLADLNQWARIVEHFLKPNGDFVFVEFHPVVWMFSDEFNSVAYSYFKGEPIIEKVQGTYADREADSEFVSVNWNHGLAEVVTALLSTGLEIKNFNEYNYSPYNCFLGTEEFEPGKFRIAHFENKIPMVYSISAKKK
ncbi:MAG: class I SAM-dependent methyltransferase [Saprospiraceae bacterium]